MVGSSWRTPLRIARRTARRSLGRTVLIATLIGLPVLAASWVAVMETTSNPRGEVLARQSMGTADASVTVTPYKLVTLMRAMMDPSTAAYIVDTGNATAEQSRDPARVDVAALLPAGSKVVPDPDSWTTAAGIKVGSAIGNYQVRGLDARGPLATGTYRLDQGRMPTGPGEVALSPSMADHLGLRRDGSLTKDAAVETAAGKRYAVTGIARQPLTPSTKLIWTLPGSPLAPAPHDSDLAYLVDLPDGADPLALQQQLAGKGIAVTPRAWVLDPPAFEGGGSTYSDVSAVAVAALVIGFGVLEIVLLAGTAFAVGARRQTRELGLVMAAGGTPRHVRRIVLAQGLFLGLIGTVAGVVLAIAAAVLGKSRWELWFDHLIDGWRFPVVVLAAIAAVGLLAGLAAAVVPAVTAARQQPVAALAGRFTVAKGNSRLRRPALVLLVLGVGSVLVGTTMLGTEFARLKREALENPNVYAGGITPTTPIALVLTGITAVIAAMVWLLPNLVAKAAALGSRLPLSARLALRDAARHRHRTGPATAAIMMSVGGTVAIAFALVNSFAAESANYVPSAHDGDAVVRYDSYYTDGVTRAVDYTPELVGRLDKVLPDRGHTDLAHVKAGKPERGSDYQPVLSVTAPADAACTDLNQCSAIYMQIVAVDPAFLESLGGHGPAAAEVLRAGKAAIPESFDRAAGKAGLIPDGKLVLRADTTNKEVGRVPAAKVTDLPRLRAFESAILISPDTARRLGDLDVFETHFDLTREPTADERAAAVSAVGVEQLFVVEHGYQSKAGTAFLALLSAATVVTLLGVAISVALSAAEGRADLATLAAVGAQPRRRRNLAAAQAWLLGQLGCVLGAFVGGLYGYTAHVAFDSPRFAIPWRELGGILVAVPLFAGLVAWLLTRSRLPMVRRAG